MRQLAIYFLIAFPISSCSGYYIGSSTVGRLNLLLFDSCFPRRKGTAGRQRAGRTSTSNYHYFHGVDTISQLPRYCSHALSQRRFVKQSLGSSASSSLEFSSATIDYSSVNEYYKAHYGGGNSDTCYFPYDSKDETIYNARTQLEKFQSSKQEMMQELGMTLLRSPSKVTKWDDLQQIANVYIPELESILRSSLFPNKNVLMTCFWNSVIRSNVYNVASSPRRKNASFIPTANVASAVHIDTDIGAYDDIGEFLSLVENNRIASHGNDSFDMETFLKAIVVDKKRFAIVNFWRNILDEPVQHFPLAILATKYPNVKHAPVGSDPTSHAFPDACPDMNLSKWYTFPNVTNQEVIVFYQYDRLVTQPSDLWHCAISTISDDDLLKHQEQSVLRRKSLDVRALVVLDEEIPSTELDRFKSTRTRSLLTLEESACFCEQQADARRQD